MGKSTISMVIFNSYVKLPEGIVVYCWLLLLWVHSYGYGKKNTQQE